MAHMVWGKGGLLNGVWAASSRRLDFAGGTVVHITSGVSALVCALYLGKRNGYPQRIDAAAQRGAERHRRVPAVGRLVRIQRRQRAGGGGLATSAFVATHFARRRGGPGLDGDREWMTARQAQRAGRDLGRGGRTGRDHSGVRIRQADAGDDDRLRRRAWSATWGAPK